LHLPLTALHFPPKPRSLGKTLAVGPFTFCVAVTQCSSAADVAQISVPQTASHVCMLCKRQFPDTVTLEEHKVAEHGVTKFHMCYLCADGFVDADALQQHIASRHTGRARIHAFVCPICAESSDAVPRSFPQQGLLTKHLHSAHRMSRDEAAVRARAAASQVATGDVFTKTATNAPTDGSQAVRRLYVKGQTEFYHCAQCEFSTDDRDAFIAHVKVSHRPEPVDAVQCMECSQCFPVVPALQRHLRLVHRMSENIDRYLLKIGRMPVVVADADVDWPAREEDTKLTTPRSATTSAASASKAQSESSVSANSSPLECTVCYRLFFTVDQLRAHMRVHGMAFIQGTRRKQSST
jgi:hypothetical protein